MVNNFLMGGKLGDFLHSLFAVKHLNTSADVYMYDIGWEFGINNTYEELRPILLNQNYIRSLSILTDYELDPVQTSTNNTPVRIKNSKLVNEGYVDLGGYIRSPWLYKACWSELYANTFNFIIGNEYAWITHNKIDERFVGKVVIHRRNNPARLNNDFPFNQIIEQYGDDIIFVSSNEDDYRAFPHQHIPFVKITTLDEWFTTINSCGLMISNLTSPAVIAHALDVPRLIELPNTLDAIHCMGEEKYSTNVNWYLSDTQNTLYEKILN